MIDIQKITSLETVLTFRIHPSCWTASDHSLLYESMILAGKENPDWTYEQALETCEHQVNQIINTNFKTLYSYALQKISYLYTFEQALKDYKTLGQLEFQKELNYKLEFLDFAKKFYDILREKYNADSELVWKEFAKMKKNNWSYEDYKQSLKRKN